MEPESNRKQPNIFHRSLWWCAGTDPTILRDFPDQWNKYSSMGLSVFLTGLLASLSGAYAANLMVKNMVVGSGLGIIWGVIILNLDRLSVSSIRRVREPSKAAGLRNLTQAIPRVLLAFMTAIVITSPLQIKLFEREIDQQLKIDQIEPLRRIDDVMAKKNGELEGLRNAIQSANSRADQAQELMFKELSGQRGSLFAGSGPIYRERRREYDQAREEAVKTRNELEPKIIQTTAELAELTSRRQSLLSDQQQFAATFFTKVSVLSSLAQRDTRIAAVRYSIILLFLLLETAPIVVKLLSPTDPYEQALVARHEASMELIRRMIGDRELKSEETIEQRVRDAVVDALNESALKHVK